MTTGAFAQGQLIKQTTPVPVGGVHTTAQSVSRNTVTCGNDTVLYPLAKATGASLYTLVGNGGGAFGEGFAQYYDAPQAITISGVEFFGRTSTGTATVNVKLYTANPADSTPVVQLATVPVVLNTTTASLSAMTRHAMFSSPVTVTGPYVISVEGVSTAVDTFQLATNADGDGMGERLSSVRVLGTLWLNAVDAFGVDADFLAHPIVNYDITASFTVSGSPCPAQMMSFTNTSSPVLSSRFYNQTAFFGLAPAAYTWDAGDASGITSSIDYTHAYTAAGSYTATLNDTIFGWTMTCFADTSAMITVNGNPNAAFTLSSGTITQGDTVDLMNTSVGSGCTVNWGDGTPEITSCSDTSHTYLLPGTFTVTVITQNPCGADTATSTVTVNISTGILNSQLESALSIFPNPANDHINVNIALQKNGQVTAGIYTMTGSLVKEYASSGTNADFVFSTTDLSAGLYMIKVRSESETVTKKITIIK